MKVIRKNLVSVVNRNVLRPTRFEHISKSFDVDSSSRLGFRDESVSKQIHTSTYFCLCIASLSPTLAQSRALCFARAVHARRATMTELSIKLDTVTGFEPKVFVLFEGRGSVRQTKRAEIDLEGGEKTTVRELIEGDLQDLFLDRLLERLVPRHDSLRLHRRSRR